MERVEPAVHRRGADADDPKDAVAPTPTPPVQDRLVNVR
jgi:hypothetical protein